VKNSFETGAIRSRTLPPAVVSHFTAKINALQPHVEEVLQAEALARMDRLAEMEAVKAQNIIEHSDEIMARPQREWFTTEQQKKATKEAAAEKKRMIAEKAGTGMHKMTRKKRRAREARDALDAAQQGDSDDDGPSKPMISAKAVARKVKTQQADTDREQGNMSIHDHDESAKKRAAKKLKKRKGVPATEASGDGSMFQDEKITFAKKPTKAKEEPAAAKSSFEFRGFDPNRKLGKKKGHKAFKSRAKHKRR